MNKPFTFLQSDKALHFLISFFICAVLNKFLSYPIAIVLTIAIGVIKEFWDKKRGGKVDKMDLLADIGGIVLAVL